MPCRAPWPGSWDRSRSSSANRSGEPDARTAEALVASLGPSLAVVIDDGPVRGGVPSSVVAVDAAGRVAVLREGAIERSMIDAMFGEKT